MLPSSLDPILEELHLDADISGASKNVLLARHAKDSFKFFQRSVEAFEEYQRFQTKHYFKGRRYIISFLGVPERGTVATFGGIYQILGVSKRGEPGFREPEGDPEVVASCAGSEYLYSLARLTQYDWLRTQWDIDWNEPANHKYRNFEPKLAKPTMRFADQNDLASIRALIQTELVEENRQSVSDPDEIGFSEGAAAYSLHLKRERKAALVELVKEQARSNGSYHCYVCSFDFAVSYGIDYIECHHTLPVSAMLPGDKTKPEDCVLLCANCHRAVHKQAKILSKLELLLILKSPASAIS